MKLLNFTNYYPIILGVLGAGQDPPVGLAEAHIGLWDHNTIASLLIPVAQKFVKITDLKKFIP